MTDSGPDAAAAPVPQRAIIVAASTVEFDSRTMRLASTLGERGHAVTVLARGREGLPDDERRGSIRIQRVRVGAADVLPLPEAIRRRLRDPDGHRTERLARSAPTVVGRLARAARVALTDRAQARFVARIAPAADVIHAMAFLSLSPALAISRRQGGTPVIYDARDIYASAANIARLPGFVRRSFARFERRLARRARRVVTVNEPYADVLAGRLGPPRPLVAMNGPSRSAQPPTPQRRFHETLDLAPGARVVLYHGGFSPDRGIEQLIEALPLLPPEATLVLLGYGELLEPLRRRVGEPALAGRLHVLPAVAPDVLLDWVASADVAAMPIQPTTLNHRLTTPNKLFEAMAAGTPVVASDLPGMAPIVRDTRCGVLCDPTEPAAIAAAIRTVLEATDEQRDAWCRGGREAAAGRYSWEEQVAGLLAEYGRITGRPW
jgi:glycosyltransferase involved in cell wall biosynthesis